MGEGAGRGQPHTCWSRSTPASTHRMTVSQPHSVNIEVNGTDPSEILVGTEFVLKVQVSCSDGCGLAGVPVKTIGPDGLVREFATSTGGTLDASLQAPPR